MEQSLMPRIAFSRFPRLLSWPSVLEDEDWFGTNEISTGLSISEDDTNVYVDAAVPGIDPKDVEVTFDKGVLWVRGEAKEEVEDKERKYYRKSQRSFSYRTVIPDTVDEMSEPQVTDKHGMLQVIFQKLAKTEPKKLKVKTE